ncbi:MAG: hypothetical protein AAGB51_13410 [Planctomycetota bacterium]
MARLLVALLILLSSRAFGQRLVPPPEVEGVVIEIERHAEGRIWSAWLGNGVRVHALLLPPDVPSDLGAIAVTVAGGPLYETRETRGVASALAQVLARPALPGLIPEETGQVLDGAGIRLRGGTRGDAVMLTALAPRDGLADAAAALRVSLSSPAVDVATIAEYTGASADRLERLQGDVFFMLEGALRESLFPPGDSRGAVASPVELASIDADAVAGFYELHVRSAPLEVAVASSLPPIDALTLMASEFGSLPERPRIMLRMAPELRVPRAGPRRVISKGVAPGDLAGVLVAVPMPGFDELPRLRAVLKAQSIAVSRLQEMALDGNPEWGGVGLERWTRVFSAPLAHPGVGWFGFAGEVPAEQAEALRFALISLLEDLSIREPTEEELAAAQTQIGSELASGNTPLGWAVRCVNATYRGLDVGGVFETQARYEAIDGRDIRRAFESLLDRDEHYEVVLLPKE